MSQHTSNPQKKKRRRPGWEVRVLVWIVRNPVASVPPVVLVASLIVLGVTVTGYIVGGLAFGLLAWNRAHPDSFDQWAAPRLRASYRRYTRYRGKNWSDLLGDCDLTRENRFTGQLEVPRLTKVSSPTPSIDVLRVRPLRGQDLRVWSDRAEALTDAMNAHRVALAKQRPGQLTMVIERSDPFVFPVPPPEIPELPEHVVPSALEIGEDEYGEPVTVSVAGGKHLLGAGASGSGKSSLVWCPLFSAGPLIRDAWLRVWGVDMKNGTELEIGKDLFHEYATNGKDAMALVSAFRANMEAKQVRLREAGKRRMPLSAQWPGDLLVIDELAMLTAYGEGKQVREIVRMLAVIMTQGRATSDTVFGFLQEPTKDVLEIRELFVSRICLAVTSASHVNMTLGEDARERGALADEIPIDDEHGGIGFRIDKGSRLPRRIRAGFTQDEDVTDLAKRFRPQPPPPGGLTVVRDPKQVA